MERHIVQSMHRFADRMRTARPDSYSDFNILWEHIAAIWGEIDAVKAHQACLPQARSPEQAAGKVHEGDAE